MYTKYVSIIEMNDITDLIPYRREEGPILDFEKIIPTPEDFFTIESDSDLTEDFEYIHLAMDLAKREFDHLSTAYNPCIDKTHHTLELLGVYEKGSKEIALDGLKFGENFVKYGAVSRRDWRLANWGSISTGLHYTPLSGIHLGIVTLGGSPVPVIRKLSTMVHDKCIKLRTFTVIKSGSIDVRGATFENDGIYCEYSFSVSSLAGCYSLSHHNRKFVANMLNQ